MIKEHKIIYRWYGLLDGEWVASCFKHKDLQSALRKKSERLFPQNTEMKLFSEETITTVKAV